MWKFIIILFFRYEGPAGAPGMPEMLSPGSALQGAGIIWKLKNTFGDIHIYQIFVLRHHLLINKF